MLNRSWPTNDDGFVVRRPSLGQEAHPIARQIIGTLISSDFDFDFVKVSSFFVILRPLRVVATLDFHGAGF